MRGLYGSEDQGVIIAYTAVVMAKTWVKMLSNNQLALLVLVKRSKAILNSIEQSRCS